MSSIQVVNDWTFSKTLGSGVFGIVELWRHKSGNKVAIKKCKWDVAQLKEIQKEKWTIEVQIMKNLKHPNVVKALDLCFNHPDENRDLPILCMEFCREGDLRQVLNKPENCCGVTEKEAIVIMKNISSAVEYLHSNNITHRDLKPENIVLQDECNEISYKLIDLGCAKELGEASSSASLIGPLNYVAPELFLGTEYSCSVDYWSLAILFYEVISGTRPFFPEMQITTSCMMIIQNKGYNDICAYESEGKHVFGQDIMGPTNLASCLKNKLVDWFRVMLQWDPKKRGKLCDENGEMQLVAFKLLQTILSKQIVYVFSVPMYKIDAYEISDSTTGAEVQLMIEKDTSILVNQQILTNYNGKVLIPNNASLLSETQDSILFVFKRNSHFAEFTSTQGIPMPIQKIIEQSKNSLDFRTLMDYYRVAINFMKQDANLFQLYTFALTIKIDLVISQFNKDLEHVGTVLLNIKVLQTEVSAFQVKLEKQSANEEKLKCLQQIFKKICTVVKAAEKIELMFNSLDEERNRLESNAQRIDYVGDMLQLYTKALDMYELHKIVYVHKHAKPIEMVKLIFNFLTIRENLSHNINIFEIIKQTKEFEHEIFKMKEIFKSVIIMSTVYRHEFLNVRQCISNPPIIAQNEATYISTNNVIKMSNYSSITDIKITELDKVMSDSIIYENVEVHHRLSNLLREIQKNFTKVISLEG